jgi:hypothetical protein
MKKPLIIIALIFNILALLFILLSFQQRQYTLTGSVEQMIALRLAVEGTTMPHNEAIKVEQWLYPQLARQDMLFAKQDSIAKVKRDSVERKGGK